MFISFKCPHCRTALQDLDNFADMKNKCPKCKKEVIVSAKNNKTQDEVQEGSQEGSKKEWCVRSITGGLVMTDKMRELLSKIEHLIEAENQSEFTKLAGEQTKKVFPEVDRLLGSRRRRIRFKLLDEHGLEKVLEKVDRIMRHEFFDFSEFHDLTNRISELALDAKWEIIGVKFTKDNLFIVPIVNKKHKVVGRSVFTFIQEKKEK